MPENNQIFECENCGGEFEKIQEGKYKCKFCGFVKEIQTSTSGEILSLLNDAGRLRRNGDFDEAFEIYQTIVKKDPNNPEGYWGSLLSEYGIYHEEDPKTKRHIPTLHRISKIPVFENSNYKMTIEKASDSQKIMFKESAEEIEKIRAKTVKISENEPPYDVFICYKRTSSSSGEEESYTKDSVNARMIFDKLTEQGYKVFFAEKTLQNLAGTEYEPIIFNALNTSKVMLVICSKPEYINSTWVKNEWRRFLKLMEYDQSKKIIPVLQDMPAGMLPDLLKKHQALEINANFESNLVSSVTRILGVANKANIQRVSIDQKKASKKSNVIKSNIESREIKVSSATKLVVSDQVQIRNAFLSLKNKAYDMAIDDFFRLRENPKLTAMCDFGLCFIRFQLLCRWVNPKIVGETYLDLENKSLLKYLASNAKLSDSSRAIPEADAKELTEKFNACVENSDQEILNLVFEEMEREYFATENTITQSYLYIALSGWESETKKKIFAHADGEIKSSQNHYCKPLYDAVVKCFDSQDVNGYIKLLENYGDMFLKNFSFSMALDAYNKILEVDEGNVGVRWKRFLAELQVDSSENLKWATYKFDEKTIEKFKDDVISYAPETVKNTSKSKEKTSASDIMKDYGAKNLNASASRGEYIDFMVYAIIDSIPYTKISKTSSKAFLNYATDFSTNTLEKLKIKEAISNLDENGKVFFKTNETSYTSQSVEYKKFLEKTDGLKNSKEIKTKILELQQAHGSENGENSKMFESSSISSLLQAFDKLIGFYPQSDEQKMNQRISFVGDRLKDNDYFDEAIKYYNIIVSANKKAYYAYWSILQCKLKCKTDEDLIYQKTPLKTIPEFQDAINSANDENIIARYTNVYNEQRNPNKAKRKPNTQIKAKPQLKSNEVMKEINGKSFERTKKRNKVFQIIAIVFAVIMALSILGGKLYKKKYDEDIMFGAKAITSADGLKNMTYNKKYYLAQDIDMSGADWQEFGKNFGGILYGNGHKIMNFKIPYYNGDKDYVGLFGKCENATFKNLVLENFDINFENQDSGASSNAGYLGLLLAYGKDCTIDDVKVSGNIFGTYAANCGGIVGELSTSTITNCVSSCNIYAMRAVGGIVGYAEKITAENLINNAEFVKSNGSRNNNNITNLGGIFGYFTGTASGLLNNAEVYNGNNCYNVGGIVGALDGYGKIENCTNNGKVYGGALVGGIAGGIWQDASLTGAVNNGDVTASSKNKDSATSLGGIYGYSFKSTLSNLTNYGKIITLSGTAKYIGGIGGDTWSQDHPVYENLHNYGEFVIDESTVTDVGGIFGHIYSDNYCCFTLQNSSNNVSISSKTSNVGGAIGYAQGYKSGGTYTKEVWYGGCQIYNFKQVGDITGENYVGGLVGYARIGLFDLKDTEFTGTASRFDGKTENVDEKCGSYYSGQ